MSTSIVNMPQVFNLRRFLALFRPSLYTPKELALRDLAQGRPRDALTRLDALLTRPAVSPRERASLENKRGVAFMACGDRAQARAAFDSALAAVPEHVPALVNVGNLHLENGDAAEAVRWYERAVRADDRYARAHHGLGAAFKRLGRTADAVRELRRANRLEGAAFSAQRTDWDE